MKTCYFTASGNSLYVARRIGGELLSIPQLMRQESIEIEDEAVGVVCPVYAVEMPMMVREFMKRVSIKTDYFFFVYTYGAGLAEAFGHAKAAAQEAGVELAYVNAVKMVDNYLPKFDMDEQVATLPEKDVEGQLAKVCADIEARKWTEIELTDEVRAHMAALVKKFAEPVMRKDAAKCYYVTDACTRCGTCAKVCPADNIEVTSEGVTFLDRCEVCFACLHNCPQGAIHMPNEVNGVRFRNEYVTLQDIVAANDSGSVSGE